MAAQGSDREKYATYGKDKFTYFAAISYAELKKRTYESLSLAIFRNYAFNTSTSLI